MKELDGIDKNDIQRMQSSGFSFDESARSATFVQTDDAVVQSRSLYEGVEILSVEDALERYPEVRQKYFGAAFREMGREFPTDTQGGYFIRVRKGAQVSIPLQACLYLKKQKTRQKVHNIVIAEEGSSVYLITGCASSTTAGESSHLGISEFFVERGAYMNFTMIHSWDKDIDVKPMSVTLVDDEATFVSNYVSMKPVRDITMYPTAVFRGKNAKGTFSSVIVSHKGSHQDIGSRALLRGEGSSCEIISRAVSLGGTIIARGHLSGEAKDVKAHLECRGLVVSEQGKIHAIPELETAWRDVEMSHEAAVGKINKDEIEYLQSRGFTQEEAQAAIIRGFVDVEILGLPRELQAEIKKLEDQTLKEGL